jgi:hypothetical protein
MGSAPTDNSASPSWRQEVRWAFVRRCHDLLAMGYARLDPSSLRAAEETEITGDLVDAIRAVTEDPDSPRWVARYECADDPPVTTPERRGKRRRRVDLAFVRTQHGPRRRFQVEAKRLYCSASLGEYLGSDGLQRFLNGDYAAEHPDAGMLGYVQTDTPAAWATKLEKHLGQAGGEYAVRVDGGFCQVTVSRRLSHTYRSQHDRSSVGSAVDIYHTLLSFN